MWLARDKDNNQLWLYIYNEPTKLEKTGMFKNNDTIRCAINIQEVDDRYKDITWENSPVELTYKL